MDRTRLLTVQRQWRAPPELGAVPRDARLTRPGFWIMFWTSLASAGVIGGLAFGFPGFLNSLKKDELLKSEPVAYSATVTRLWIGSGDEKPRRVAYTYNLNGERYESRDKVRDSLYTTLSVGGRVAIHYAESRPEFARIDGARHQSPWMVLMIVLFVPLLGIGPWRVLGERRLLAHGTPTAGIVTIKPYKHGQYVRYDFIDASGEARHGTSHYPKKSPMHPDSVVTVLYDPDRSRRNTIYPTRFSTLAP